MQPIQYTQRDLVGQCAIDIFDVDGNNGGTQSWVQLQVNCLNFGKLLCTKNHADQAAKIHASHIIHITSNHLHEFWQLKLHGFLCRATCQNSGKLLCLNFETPYWHCWMKSQFWRAILHIGVKLK